jgi:hypothetical protein
MKSKSGLAYEAAFTDLIAFYKSKGKLPKFQCLDNEVSEIVTELFKDNDIKLQFVPPNMHRANVAERAIRHTKNTIIAMVSAVEPDLDPRVRFEKVITQAEIIINHLKPCSRIPSISAWEGMHNSKYDFQAHPISVYGMRAIVHIKPDNRESWGNHGVEGFYLSPAIDHYRCWNFYIPSTQRARTTDTVQWLPTAFPLPGSSPLQHFVAIFDDLRVAIKTLTDSNIVNALEQQPATNEMTSAIAKIRLIDEMMNPQQIQRVLTTGTPTLALPNTITPAAPSKQPHIVQSFIPSINTPTVSTTAPQRVNTSICDDADEFPDDIKWETVHFNKLPKVAQKFFTKVGDTYVDKTDTPPVTWKVIAVVKNVIRTHRTGTAIQWYYRMYDTAKFKTTPLNIDDCEHISCDEIFKSKNVVWRGLTHAKAPTRQRTFAPNPITLRGSTSKSRRPAQANATFNAENTSNMLDEIILLQNLQADPAIINQILQFRESLHPTPQPSSASAFIEHHAM